MMADCPPSPERTLRAMMNTHCTLMAGLLLGLLLVAATLYAQGRSAPASAAPDLPRESFHLYLLIGQSNMAGRAPFSEEEAGEMERCYLLGAKDEWIPARNPLNLFSSIRKGAGMQRMNPGYTFAKAMTARDEGIALGLIVNAKGGTAIGSWAKGTKFYTEAIRRTRIAMKTGTLKGILWHQGESDHGDPDQYLAKLKALVADLRVDLGDPTLPFIAGQINAAPAINDQIAELPNHIPHTGVVRADGLKTMDRWHFDAPSMRLLGQRYAEEMIRVQRQSGRSVATDESKEQHVKRLPMPGEVFTIEGHTAFLILPEAGTPETATAWVWYAPTLPRLPGPEETWMFEQFLARGIAIAGVDVGESYGSPEGVRIYQALYTELVTQRGLSKKPTLLARSRGGLMLYNWAVAHATSVSAIAGIYPVGNLSSYPGLAKACGAYDMTTEALETHLAEHNPCDRLAPLADANVPIFHIHGDRDGTVPLEKNSGLMKARYTALGGEMILEIVEGGGHDMSPHWFRSQSLVDFVIQHAGS